MEAVRTRLGARRPSPSPAPTPGIEDSPAGVQNNKGGRPLSNGSGGGAVHAPGVTTKRPTSLDDIRQTVLKAVNASRPENAAQIQNTKQAVNDVSESQGQYCDESAQANVRLGKSFTRA